MPLHLYVWECAIDAAPGIIFAVAENIISARRRIAKLEHKNEDVKWDECGCEVCTVIKGKPNAIHYASAEYIFRGD